MPDNELPISMPESNIRLNELRAWIADVILACREDKDPEVMIIKIADGQFALQSFVAALCNERGISEEEYGGQYIRALLARSGKTVYDTIDLLGFEDLDLSEKHDIEN